jgi:protein MAK11
MNQNRPSKKRRLAPETDRNENIALSSTVKAKATSKLKEQKTKKSKSSNAIPINPKSKTKTQNTNPAPADGNRKPITVVAGSYERILYGLSVDFRGSENEGTSMSVGKEKEDGGTGKKNEVKLQPVFIFPAHISCVKALAASPQGGKWLATGSTDESIKIWDLGRKKELGSLQQHQGKSAV